MSDAEFKTAGSNHRSEPETFWYMAHKYLFNVDHAMRIVADGRETVELDEESMQFSVDTSEINWKHVARVNPERPGIIAHIFYVTDEGERIHGHLLIDGHHRAARCLQLGIPFYVQLLTESESEEILLKCPHRSELQPA